MIYLVEGARNVGKTFLIEQVLKYKTIKGYKFPYKEYYEMMFGNGIDQIGNPELFHLCIGYDLSFFDMVKKGIIKQDLIIDRSFLSHFVFAIQNGASNPEDVEKKLKHLMEYQDIFKIIYIRGENPTSDADRNKDNWVVYKKSVTEEIYDKYLDVLTNEYKTNIMYFENKFDTESIQSFINLFNTNYIAKDIIYKIKGFMNKI